MTFKALVSATCITLSAFAGSATAQDSVPETGQDITQAAKNYFPATSQELLDLIRNCETDECMSYVSGVIGGISIYAAIAENPSPFCARGNVSIETVRQAIVSTIETTPQLRDQHPALSVLTAFARHWPCVSAADMQSLKSTPVTPVAQSQIDALVASGGASVVYGDLNASEDKTLRVFHDPNCAHCRRFRDELYLLAQRGWKVEVYPVATTTEDSAGYGAVEIALRDIDPEAVRSLHDYNPDGIADITVATQLAEEAGVSNRDILTAIAKSGAYNTIENNTRAFFEMGAEGTPSWIVGTNLFGGFLTADGIESAVEDARTSAPAPFPKSATPQASMEQ
jgi:protein-disulfide isomerase